MSLHLMHPNLTTTNTTIRKSKKPTPAHTKAKAEYEVWQRKNGVHPDQLSVKSTKKTTNKLTPYLRIDDSTPKVSNGFALAGAKRSIFDSRWQKTNDDDPAMAEREATALLAAEEKKLRVAPAYSKGAYQYINASSDLTTLGKKI